MPVKHGSGKGKSGRVLGPRAENRQHLPIFIREIRRLFTTGEIRDYLHHLGRSE